MADKTSWPQTHPRQPLFWLTLLLVILALAATTMYFLTPRPLFSASGNRRDAIVILDVSASMLVDNPPSGTRLDTGKRATRQVLEKLQPENYGLLLMAGSAFWAMPLTASATTFYQYLDKATNFAISDSGSQLNPALKLLRRTFCTNKFSCQLERPLTVLVVSDGELFDKKNTPALAQLAANGFDFIFLTIDSPTGQVPSFDILGQRGPGRIKLSGQPLLSTPRPEIMNRLALKTHGRHLSTRELSADWQWTPPVPDTPLDKRRYWLLAAWFLLLTALFCSKRLEP